MVLVTLLKLNCKFNCRSCNFTEVKVRYLGRWFNTSYLDLRFHGFIVFDSISGIRLPKKIYLTKLRV